MSFPSTSQSPPTTTTGIPWMTNIPKASKETIVLGVGVGIGFSAFLAIFIAISCFYLAKRQKRLKRMKKAAEAAAAAHMNAEETKRADREVEMEGVANEGLKKSGVDVDTERKDLGEGNNGDTKA